MCDWTSLRSKRSTPKELIKHEKNFIPQLVRGRGTKSSDKIQFHIPYASENSQVLTVPSMKKDVEKGLALLIGCVSKNVNTLLNDLEKLMLDMP